VAEGLIARRAEMLISLRIESTYRRLSHGDYLQAIPKYGIWPKVKEEVKRQPEEYMKYFEDWLFTSDAEIEAYNYFGMTCSTASRKF
jgi:hypothetical protein